MAFAPPRPQSIFGRAAAPAAQIDWRLGAQVGPNIAQGMRAATAEVAKGIEKFQAAKRKKANQEEVRKLAEKAGLSAADAALAAKQPELWGNIEKVEAAKLLAENTARLAQQKQEIAMADENRKRAVAQQDSMKFVLENMPNLMEWKGGTLVPNEQALESQSPTVRNIFNSLPPDTKLRAYEKPDAMGNAVKNMSFGIPLESLSSDEIEAWGTLDKPTRDRLRGVPADKVVIGGSAAANAINLPSTPGKGYVVDANGKVKMVFNATSESMSRYKEFVNALRKAKGPGTPATWEPDARTVEAYFLNDQRRLDLRDFAMLISQLHGNVTADQAKALAQVLGGGGGGGGGSLPKKPPPAAGTSATP